GPSGALGDREGNTRRDADAASAAAGVDRRAGSAMRLLPERHADPGCRPALDDQEPDGAADQASPERASVPVRHLHPDHQGDPTRGEGGAVGEGGDGMSAIEEKTIDVFGATLSRGKFVKGAGALVVGLSVAGATTAGSTRAANGLANLDPTAVASWIEIHPNNTITMRTGVGEMGQGSASGALAQVLAEELNVSYDQITQVIMGDTDNTPDGGISAGFLMKRRGSTQPEPFGQSMLNMQRAAAYTYQGLLALASTKLGVPVGQLSAKNGVVSGGGKTMTYGQLVADQAWTLKIPATGTQ